MRRRLGFLTLAIALVATTALSAPRSTGASCAGCQLFLPIIGYDPVLSLISPADGVTTASLAPILQWTAPITGTYQIQVSPDPAFPPVATLPLSETKTVDGVAVVDSLLSSNLPQQTTFYWRVGLRKPGGYAYTPTSHFTTPIRNSSDLPPGVPLLAPPNGSTAPGTSLVLQWQAIPGALYYRIRVYDANNVLFGPGSKEVHGNATSLAVAGLAHGQTYHWKVKALNAYGWGRYLPDFYFTVP